MQRTASLGALARACWVFSRFWTLAASREPRCEPDPFQPFDTLAAFSLLRGHRPPLPVDLRGIASRWREGWTVAACDPHANGSACIQLQRLDRMLDGRRPVFASDGDAWQHVVARARAGSLLHAAALALVDRHERRLIEAACGPG